MKVVIVALPQNDDPVWKLSSEKKPHMTLLFLGEVEKFESVQHILDIVEHSASIALQPFYMSTKERGLLGPEDADVLFFDADEDRRPRGDSSITRFRSLLLTDPTIKTFYDTNDPYPNWTPHLTLGYPSKPAKKDEQELLRYGGVFFDRIAVWTDNYEGPEFKLERTRQSEVEEVAMADEVIDFLEHHGVKGMHWGQRKADDSSASSTGSKTTAKAEKRDDLGYTKAERKAEIKWSRKAASMGTFFKAYNAAAQKMNDGEIARINNKPEYKGKDFTSDSPLRQKYYKEHSDALNKAMNEAHKEIVGESPTGRREFKYAPGAENSGYFEITFKDGTDGKVKHADLTDEPMKIKLKLDDKGHILSMVMDELDGLSHSIAETFLANFTELKHFGVKGMKWGQRKEPVAASVVSSGGKKIVTKGGTGQDAHPDALRTAVSKQTAKKSSTDALSTKDLQELVNRMNLEQQFSKLTVAQKSPGQKFVNDLLVSTVKSEATKYVNQQGTKVVSEALKKKAAAGGF